MPKYWYDRGSNKSDNFSEEDRSFNLSIIADRKPYFMRYIYPTLMKQYNTYISSTNKNALRLFGVTVSEMLEKPTDHLTDRELEFLQYYDSMLPVSNNDCVMNRICRRFEQEFDGYIKKYKDDIKFDYTILKSGRGYYRAQVADVKRLHEEYNKRIADYAVFTKNERIDAEERIANKAMMIQEFKRDCLAICSTEEVLCDILLDICYTKESSKQFAWDLSGEVIIENLLRRNNYQISFPERNEYGDFEFQGDRFSFFVKQIGGD